MYLKFSADRIFTGEKLLGKNYVLVTDEAGVVEELVREEDAGDDIKTFKGILSPGFINCHCHLELSHMKGLIPKHTGLVDFVLSVIAGRNAEPGQVAAAIEKGEQEMLSNGIVAVGDICNNENTIAQKSKHNLWYHNFIEVSGFPPLVAAARFQRALELYAAFSKVSPANSIVPHAPYSVSKELFEMIDQFLPNKILSIHNQETENENVFFKSRSGDFFNIYEKIGVDISFFEGSGKSSLQTWLPYLTQARSLISVHNVATSLEDINFQKANAGENRNVFYCLCPNANLYISRQLPDIPLLLKETCSIVLGTDSLASNDQLSILEEIKTVLKSYPGIPTEVGLTWATSNGAKALGIDNDYGSFEKNKKPGIVLIQQTENDALHSVHRIL